MAAVDVVARYLSNQGEPEVEALADFPSHLWRHVIVIPAYRENGDFIARLAAFDNLLVLVVINQPDRLPGADPQNLRLLAEYSGNTAWQCAKLRLTQLNNQNSHCLLVDRTAAPIPAHQGVGLARKLGNDLALALWHRGAITRPWLWNSDADAHLPTDYFAIAPNENSVACVYPFRHLSVDVDTDSATAVATRLYEQTLNYYVAGLRWAGSPYAYHTLGSTQVISCDAYAKVRGYPKRSGGEDFYLLNKVAKLGAVESLIQPTIALAARQSDRVPFGTGPAVGKIVATGDSALFYHPQCFVALKQLLTKANAARSVEQFVALLDATEREALETLGLDRFSQHCHKQQLRNAGFAKHWQIWFDGFLTLKFIHFAERSGLCKVDYDQVSSLPFGQAL